MTHFYPKPKFFVAVQKSLDSNGLRIVFEAGCGECKNFAGYDRQCIKHLGCDPWFDPLADFSLANRVMPLPVHRCSIVKSNPMLIVVCRPDHSGWVRNIVQYMHAESVLLYVGLKQNVPIDLPDVEFVVGDSGLGRDGETAYIARSQTLQPDLMCYETIEAATFG